MRNISVSNILALIFASILFSGCNNKLSSRDVARCSDSSVVRFDKDFYSYLQSPTGQAAGSLMAKYPSLIEAIAISAAQSEPTGTAHDYLQVLKNYYSHPALLQIYRDAEQKFEDISSFGKEMQGIAQTAVIQLPAKKLPGMSFHISGFKENVIVTDSIISMSIDKYLGSDYAGYGGYFHDYERQQMQPRHIVRDYLRAWLMSEVISQERKTLLDAMVYQGKILYAISVLLPGSYSGADIIGYTPQQMDWCANNEKQIWKIITGQSNINTPDRLIISGYTDDAPYTIPLGKESPGRAGAWVGWQIVKQYARKNNASLQDILNSDAGSVLKGARYNP